MNKADSIEQIHKNIRLFTGGVLIFAGFFICCCIIATFYDAYSLYSMETYGVFLSDKRHFGTSFFIESKSAIILTGMAFTFLLLFIYAGIITIKENYPSKAKKYIIAIPIILLVSLIMVVLFKLKTEGDYSATQSSYGNKLNREQSRQIEKE
jgi:hypothetical protein